MLFIVKSTHDYSTCQTHHPEKGPLFSETLANLGHHGVKVHAQYSNRLEHVLFIVCEAETLSNWMRPLIQYSRWGTLRSLLL